MENRIEGLATQAELPELDQEIEKKLEQESSPFVGQWNRLISTTNWEKGAIISRWRKLLQKINLPEIAWTDERWSQIVGGITPQHVGRLRRTWDRFHAVYQQYEGLYWSHFCAALDWDDAEMWLEGAVQNGWSVSQMRRQRWEVQGKITGEEPPVTEIMMTEAIEEAEALAPLDARGEKSKYDGDYPEGPLPEGPDFGDENMSGRSTGDGKADGGSDEMMTMTAEQRVRPFESFENLPDDIDEAVSQLKIAIIRHKAAGWEEISLDEMLALLDALKQLATSPAE